MARSESETTAVPSAGTPGPPVRPSRPLTPNELAAALVGLSGWECNSGALVKSFKFARYADGLAFVQAVGTMAGQIDHHPLMVLGFRTCRVEWTTHSVGALTELDTLAAARTDQCTAAACLPPASGNNSGPGAS